ncbi:pilin, partial [Patescibacteria group bacterium]|nr:pilin [Patescibacteria group bacterium]
LLITFFNININISIGADDCGTAAGTSGYKCMDMTGYDIAKYQCATGHCPGGANNVCCKSNNEASTKPVDSTKPTTNSTVSLPNPIGSIAGTSIPTLLGNIIKSVLGVVGSLALVMFIYGGITWMLSGGNQEQVTKGKNILIWATIGIVIIFTSYALVKFVLTAINS